LELRPLIVDLDGTLINTDMLHESVLSLLKNAPLQILLIPLWLYKGKAILKSNLATLADFDPNLLPYNETLITWLKQKKIEGRVLVLCTATDITIANKIAEHLGIFDEVIASDGVNNLAGENKALALKKRYGEGAFDYAGNSKADLAVWKVSHAAIVVNAGKRLEAKAKALFEVEKIFTCESKSLSGSFRMLRIHQWMKNLLIFVPLLAAHQYGNIESWVTLAYAFVSYSLCASVVYIANDLLDLESDRLHPRKRKRPFASGQIPVWIGVLIAPLLLTVSVILGAFVGKMFLLCLGFYFALTCVYSCLLKRLILIDCLTLAMLYTLRVVAGAIALGQFLSFWLLAFSVFLFLSLAFVKRYAELEIQQLSGNLKINGRGYHTSDASIIQSMGIVSGYTSVLVLALYLNSEAVVILYRFPELIWGAVPIMLLWISWMWMQAHRGNMHDDPLVFAAKDPVSLISALLVALVMIAGSVGLPQW
jgi:4-hydroxybenzoate polyprenyltransferase/phosphoserine phosphatase